MNDTLTIDGIKLQSRLFLGTAQYPSPDILRQAIEASDPGLLTVSLRRENAAGKGQKFWDILKDFDIPILPNTAGCYSPAQAITTAEMAREIFQTNWIKLEVIENDFTLAPDPKGLLEAAQKLSEKGFKIFPYMTDDIDLAQNLTDCGCDILMPWGAPIGTGRGLNNSEQLAVFRETFTKQTLVVDAGIGAPSHAALAMELGYDAVLLNTAVAKATDPVKMARAMANAIHAGREGYLAGIIKPQTNATPSSPSIDRPFWHQEQQKNA